MSSVPEEFVDSEWPAQFPAAELEKKNKMAKGYVSWVGSKPMYNKIYHTFKLKNNQIWFNCGVTDPQVKINDQIEFEYVEENGRATVSPGSIRHLVADTTVHQGTPSADLPKTSGKSEYQLKDEYWRNKELKDDAKAAEYTANASRIQWQSARNAAIEMVGILVTNDKLKLPEKNPVDAILGKVADLTERFYRESGEAGVLGVAEEEPLSSSAA